MAAVAAALGVPEKTLIKTAASLELEYALKHEKKNKLSPWLVGVHCHT